MNELQKAPMNYLAFCRRSDPCILNTVKYSDKSRFSLLSPRAQKRRLYAMMVFFCLFVCLFVCSSVVCEIC